MIATQPESRTMIMNVVNEVGRVYGELSHDDRRYFLDLLKIFTDFPDVAHLKTKAGQYDECRAAWSKSGITSSQPRKEDRAKRHSTIREIYEEVRSQYRERAAYFNALAPHAVIVMVNDSPQWIELGFVEGHPLKRLETIKHWRTRAGFTDAKSPKYPKPSLSTLKRVITSLHRKNSGS
jgi:hypothetical protein